MQRLIFFLVIFFFSCVQITFGSVIFEDDFESGNLSKINENTGARWTASNSGQSDYVTVSSERSHSGNYSLKFFFAGNSNLNDDSWAEQRFNMGQTQTELFMRFYIYFPSNYKIRTTGGSNNTKFFNIWGTSYSDPMTIDMEIEATNGACMKATKAGYPSYLTCSGHVGVVPGLSPWTLNINNLGRWNCFEVHLKRDSGAGDGEIQLWIDGDIVIDGTNLSWVGAPCSPGYFLNGYLMGWSNSGFDEDTSVYIDDIVIADGYIGPFGPDGEPPGLPGKFEEVPK